MKQIVKEVKDIKSEQNSSRKAKAEKKESCRFLFDMIGRLFPRG